MIAGIDVQHRPGHVDGVVGEQIGGRPADVLSGGPRFSQQDSRIFGRGGDDVLRGASGDDLLSGGPGPDKVTGGEGADRILGAGGYDFLEASDGDREIEIRCGTGGDEVIVDGRDPEPLDCEQVALIAPGGGTN